jgi:long-chain acyl-CoA synthetase
MPYVPRADIRVSLWYNSFARVMEELLLSVGGSIGYYRGDVKKLVEDIGALRPTIFVGVPRVYEKIQMGVLDKVAKGSWLSRLIFEWAYRRKRHFLRNGWRYNQVRYLTFGIFR